MKRTFDETTLGIDYLYYTSTLLCSATNNVAANNTEIYCPFIPDTISIHMCAQGLPDEKNGVVTFNAYSQLGAVADSSTAAVALQTVVATSTDLIPGVNRLAVCNFLNTYNPVTRFSNTSRKEFRGKYNIAFLFPPDYNALLTGASFVVTIEFSRKRTKEDI